MALHPQLQQLRQKIQLVLKQLSLAQKNTRQLQAENEKLKERIVQLSQENSGLTEKYTAKNISAMPQSAEGKKDLEKRINTYLKEIDKCLELLKT